MTSRSEIVFTVLSESTTDSAGEEAGRFLVLSDSLLVFILTVSGISELTDSMD